MHTVQNTVIRMIIQIAYVCSSVKTVNKELVSCTNSTTETCLVRWPPQPCIGVTPGHGIRKWLPSTWGLQQGEVLRWIPGRWGGTPATILDLSAWGLLQQSLLFSMLFLYPSLSKVQKHESGYMYKVKYLKMVQNNLEWVGPILNPFRTKTPKYLFLRGNKPLLYHQIGNRHYFIFIKNQ